MPVIIGTYNMSFAGDKFPQNMPKFPSEYSFHERDTLGSRTFWNNAKNHLMKFITEKNPLAVGLQEMNVKELEPDFKADDDGGINGIKKALSDDYKIISGHVITNDAALSIIYDSSKLTFEKKHTVDNPNQGGRPLFMVLMKPTNNDDADAPRTLLVNMHGAQNPSLGGVEEDFNDYMIKNNRDFLQEQVKTFLGATVPEAIYIMGDFNDRYDAIQEFDINGAKVTYTGDSPAACCHNWDSMGNENNRNYILKNSNNEESDKFQGKPLAENSKAAYDSTFDVKINKPNGKVAIPEDHGITINDYLYKGDKIFAYIKDKEPPSNSNLAIYTGDDQEYMTKPSDKSDHELVYMQIPDANQSSSAGGKRKSYRGRKSKKHRKSYRGRKSKKHRKSNRKTKKRGKK